MPFSLVRPQRLGRLLIPLTVLAAAPVHAAEYFLVGLVDGQSRCQYASIQAALNAAAANGPGLDYIMVSNTVAHTIQSLRVGAQSVLIEGGYANCDLDPDDLQPYADIVGNMSDPVIRIEPMAAGNYEVRLSKLRVRSGGRSDANGGGVRVATSTNAHVRLSLEGVEVTGNRAQSGGGLHAQRGGSPAGNFSVTLHPGTRVHDNTAASNGGGLSLWGGNTFIAADDVRIDNNRANGAGGGIATMGDTYIATGNPDIDRYPPRKDVGGARIENNRAFTLGGGLYLAGAGTTMEAREIIVDGNRAEGGGGGIAVANDAILTLVREYPNAFGWTCPAATECTRISNNQVGDGTAIGTMGGGIAVYANAIANLVQTIVRDNRAQDASGALVDGANAQLRTDGAVFTGNLSYDSPSVASSVIRMRYMSPNVVPKTRIFYSTFAGNTRRATDDTLKPALDIIGVQGVSLQVASSTFHDAGITMYSEWGGDCLIASLGTSFSSNGIIHRRSTTDRPPERIFLAPGRRDWRPRFDSPITDVCDTLNAPPQYLDRDLRPRCRDELKPDRWGICDVGAWENDQLFASGVD